MGDVEIKGILIADDHAVMREGLKRILGEYDDLKVVGEAGTGEEAIEKVRKNAYDLVIMDVSMPGRGGIDAVREIRRFNPDLPVLVLSMYPDDQYAMRAFRSGASGYVMKERSPEELVDAIRKVLEGGTHVTPSLAEKLAEHLASGMPEHPHETLSDREDLVLRMLVTGQSLKDIAEELDLSVKTVSTYKRRIFEKMKMKNVADLIRYCLDHHLV